MKRFNGDFWKKALAVVLSVGMMLAVTGCGSSSYSKNESAEIAYDSVAQNSSSSQAAGGFSEITEEVAEMKESEVEEESADSSVQSERKLIKTVDLHAETKEFDKMLGVVKEQVTALGGYIESIETYNGSDYNNYSNRHTNMVARIPKDKLDEFLDTVSGIGHVINHSENVEDVTLAYVDLESHKKMLLIEQETLLELLDQATTIEDIITIESRLSEVRYQIESMESQLRTYDNKIDYSTVYLYIEEVELLTPAPKKGVVERIIEGFKDSLLDIGIGFREFFVWFVIHIPYLVIWAVIIVVVLLVVRKLKKKSFFEKHSDMFQIKVNKVKDNEEDKKGKK